MTKRAKELTAALPGSVRYEIEMTTRDVVSRRTETNGRRAIRSARRETKAAGPSVATTVTMIWTTVRGAERRKILHQCRTDAAGRLSARGEEV